jgi:hypothetical protein
MTAKEASKTPATLKALYAQITGDHQTHQRTIAAHFRNLEARVQVSIRQRVAGQSYHAIAAGEHCTAASTREAILRGIEQLRKAIHGEPRYNRKGRGQAARIEE